MPRPLLEDSKLSKFLEIAKKVNNSKVAYTYEFFREQNKIITKLHKEDL